MALRNMFALLVVGVAVVTAYRPYPDPGPDILASHKFCERRPVDQCCAGRDDYCTVPILDTICYCDEFCNRTVADCCPDFWQFCMGVEPPPGAQTPPPPVLGINNCKHMGVTHQLGAMITANCNNCTCVEVDGIHHKEWNWKCTQHICLIRPEIISHVNKHKVGWRAGNYTWLYGMTLDEGVLYRLGTFRPLEPVTEMTSLRVNVDEVMPEFFDARQQWPGMIHSVLDQGNCGSSWAFSTTSVASDRLSIHSSGYLRDMLSPQHLLSCSTDAKQKGCEGGHLDRAWWFMRNHGVVSNECYPYMSGEIDSAGPCLIPSHTVTAGARIKCPSPKASRSRVYQASPPYRIAPKEREIMKEIMENGPVQATLEVKEDFYMYNGGVYRYSMPAESLFPNHVKTGFHSVRIIGWGKEVVNGREQKYWLCANSWGKRWGERGYFRIVRGEDECKIESFVLGVWGKVNGRQIIRRHTSAGLEENEELTNFLQGDAPARRMRKHHQRKHKHRAHRRRMHKKHHHNKKQENELS